MIDRNKLSVQFHIDDFNCSSECKQGIENFLVNIHEMFKTDFKKLTIYRGKVNNYLNDQKITAIIY